MQLKGFAVFAMLLAVPQAQLAASGQANDRPAASLQAQAGTPSRIAAPAAATGSATVSAAPAGSGATKTDCQSGPCDYQPPHITIATPAPAPAPWPLQERIAWGANVLLALVGYAGIMLALSTLKKIERQTKFVESAATAATESAQAALLNAQFIQHSERPWVLVTVVPSPSIENGFTVIATNRGRSPARVVGMANETRIAANEAQLPGIPEYSPVDPEMPAVSIILLPGESTNIKAFCRGDVKGLCGNEEKLRRIENWEERIFLYGKMDYKNLMEPTEATAHETRWCCRYIHGRQASGLVMAGTQEYNLHT
ncbi:MAG: hypothetical protein WA802_14170 [Terracidiphilus sp.]